VFRDALSILPRVHIAFAIKANPNLSPCCGAGSAKGYGADVVSGGEMDRALAAGMPASDIVFSGVGKRPRNDRGLEEGIGQFNLESEEEGVELAALALSAGPDAPIARCASIRTSTPARMPRFPPARRKTSSACR
jgi:diaminopimelate decarboxylase